MTDRTRRWGWLLAALLIVLPARAADEDAAAVERFLARLGLIDLQILHLENQLQRGRGNEPRGQLAQRLADLYAERLITTADDKARYDDIMQRIQQLLHDVPEANTPALQVMLLQADYSRAEKLFNRWLDDPGQGDARRQACEIFARIAPQLEQFQKQLFEQLEKLQGEIDNMRDKDRLAVKQREAARLNGFASRAAFFAGWSNYYFGLCQQDAGAAQATFTSAVQGFRKILGIAEDEKYSELEVEWLGLENIHRANALVGLGLAEAALGHLDDSRRCFQFLDHVSAPPTLRDYADYWYLRGLLNVGQTNAAVKFAQQRVARLAGGATQGKVAFCVTLVRSGFGAGGNASPDELQQLGRLGVQGLARLGQFAVLRQLLDSGQIHLPEGEGGFYLTWIRAQQQMAQAEKSKAAEDYETAAATFEAALQDPQARSDVPSAAQCRYGLGWCLFRLGRLDKAVRQFEQAEAELRQSGLTKAADAGWLIFYCYYELSRKDKRFAGAAINALKAFKRNYPDSPQAARADYFLGKLQRSAASPEESIASLEKIKPGDPNYLSARAELCQLYYEQWSKRRGDKEKGPAAAAQVLKAVDQYMAAGRSERNRERQLECLLLGVDVALRSTPLQRDKAAALLQRAAPLVAALPPGSKAAVDYHYQQFRLGQQTGQLETVRSEAAWLAEHAKGTVYEQAALIVVARALDEAARAAAPAERRARQQEAERVLARLVEILGDDPAVLAENRNARAAASLLAHYQYELGKYAEAAALLEKLLAVDPHNQAYLRRSGLALFAAGQYEAALPRWRTLVAGLSRGSEPWYEAKYYQLVCLLRTDKAMARRVYRQFKLLYPTINVDAWREKFHALDRELSQG